MPGLEEMEGHFRGRGSEGKFKEGGGMVPPGILLTGPSAWLERRMGWCEVGGMLGVRLETQGSKAQSFGTLVPLQRDCTTLEAPPTQWGAREGAQQKSDRVRFAC